MNPKLVFTLWSFRKELKVVLFAFLIVLLLPVIAVILLTQIGLNIISDKLVGQDPTTQNIQIKDPRSGEVVKEINPTVVWPTKGVITLEFGQSRDSNMDFKLRILETVINGDSTVTSALASRRSRSKRW